MLQQQTTHTHRIVTGAIHVCGNMMSNLFVYVSSRARCKLPEVHFYSHQFHLDLFAISIGIHKHTIPARLLTHHFARIQVLGPLTTPVTLFASSFRLWSIEFRDVLCDSWKKNVHERDINEDETDLAFHRSSVIQPYQQRFFTPFLSLFHCLRYPRFIVCLIFYSLYFSSLF